MAPDVPKYFARIGYDGAIEPTREVLAAVVSHHARAIPFENLDPLLRRPLRLDLGSLSRKLVDEGRGGYCFEHNLLLAHILRHLGFDVVGLAARVMWNAPPGAVGPRSHMLLRVELLGQPHLVDVGFGGLTLTGVLRLIPEEPQSTPHERFRLLESGDGFIMQAQVGGQWRSLYRFDLQPQEHADYEVSSWYLCNHPESIFVRHLMAARADPGIRYGMRDNILTTHRGGELPERRRLQTAEEVADVLTRTLGIVLPNGPEIDRLLVDLAGRTPEPA